LLLATNHHLHVLDPETLDDIRLLDAPGSCVAVAHDIAAVGGREGVTLVDLRDGKLDKRAFPYVHSVAFSPDGARLGVSTATHSWEGPTLGELAPHTERGTIRHAGAWFAIGGASEVHLSEREAPAHPDAHFALVVDDFQALVDRLQRGGHEWSPAPPIFGGGRGFTRDPAGNRIEVLERAGSVGSAAGRCC